MNNPYATQTQHVAADLPAPKRPLAVSLAMACLLLIVALACYALLSMRDSFTVAMFVFMGVYMLAQAAVWWLTWLGFNWARIVTLVIIAVDLLTRLFGLSQPLVAIQFVLDAAAAYFLLCAPSRRWFGEMKTWRHERV